MTLSIVIPTWNEGHQIGGRVQFLFQYGGSAVKEVIIADGGSTDNTCAEAIHAGARLITAGKSRARQMNAGARLATGTVLYFVHADVQLPSTFVSDIEQSIARGAAAGCYRYVFASPKLMLKVNAYCTRFNRLMCRGGDQTLFVKREVFDELGGFNEYYSIMEDYDFIRRLWRKHTFHIIPKNVVVSARKYDTNSWLRVQMANLIVFMLFLVGRHPDRIKRMYQHLLNYR